MTTYRPQGNVVGISDASDYPATLVGSGALWSDDDDSTYARLNGLDTSSRNSAAQAGWTDGTFSSYVGSGGSVEIYIGFKLANIDATHFAQAGNFGWGNFSTVDLRIQAVRMVDLAPGWNDFGPVTQNLLNTSSTWAYSSPNGQLDDLFSATGAVLYTAGSRHNSLVYTCYDVLEARVTITPQGGSVAYLPTVRRHPTSAGRIWPPPATQRFRPGGGYF